MKKLKPIFHNKILLINKHSHMKKSLPKLKDIGINILGCILLPIFVVLAYLLFVCCFNIIGIILYSPFLLLSLIFKYIGGIF